MTADHTSGASRHDNPEDWVSGGHEQFETPVTVVSGAESYEREIRSLEARLSEECANSYRLAQELREVQP